MSGIRFASSLRTDADSASAVSGAVDEIRAGLAGEAPDLVLAFVSHHHGAAIEDLGPRIARETRARVLIGCTGESIVGSRREVERGPGLSVWAGCLGATDVRPFAVQAAHDADGEFAFSSLPKVKDAQRASLLLLADPFTFPMNDYLAMLDVSLPGVPALGGMASGGTGAGQNLLFTQAGVVEGGALGVVIEGAVELVPIVSQGCRPVGKPLVITACAGNVIQKLGGQTAIVALVEILAALPPADRELLQKRPFLGLAHDPRKSTFERGDFLVRGLLGADNKLGTLVVGDDSLRPGLTVQFLVRDAASASDDLRQLVRTRAAGAGGAAQGALVFSCNGRGSRMFAVPDHDISCVQSAFAEPIPAAGFFAMGEIGPVGGRNHLHGFTASVALFRERAR